MSENKAGRPKQENPKDVKVTIRFTKEENTRLEELAEKMGMTKSRLMRNLALGGLDDAEFLQKVGILPLVKNIRDYIDKVKGI